MDPPSVAAASGGETILVVRSHGFCFLFLLGLWFSLLELCCGRFDL